MGKEFEMNERIELISDTEVSLVSNRSDRITIRCNPNGLHIGDDFYDDDGLRALRDCINAPLDTGSFAALADTSAVPYTGKRMRVRRISPRRDTPECTVVSRQSKTTWNVDVEGEDYFATDVLLPLLPAPRIRPYTAIEAAKYLGREIKGPMTECRAIHSVCADCIMAGCFPLSYATLATEYTWADNGSKCGVPE